MLTQAGVHSDEVRRALRLLVNLVFKTHFVKDELDSVKNLNIAMNTIFINVLMRHHTSPTFVRVATLPGRSSLRSAAHHQLALP